MQVEIWSDVLCPWCYIGKRRFEAALSVFEHRDEVEVVWRSFELDPEAEAQYAGTANERLAAKYKMSVDDAQARHDEVTAAAKTEGLDFDFSRARPGNSFDAHRLIHLAESKGLQGEAKERFMRAYFTEGSPLGDQGTLKALALEVGLAADEVDAVLSTDAYADSVRLDERTAGSFGINAVPYFVIDRTYGVAGAQPARQLLGALRKAYRDAPQADEDVEATSAAACEVGGDC